MTDKELRHLSKGELIELLYQAKKNEAELREELADAKKRLEDRRIRISEAGSIAEAALSVNGIFEAAQKAADDYLAQVRVSNAELEERCKRRELETERKCRRRERESERIIEEKWAQFRTKAEEFIAAHPELGAIYNRKK